MQHLDYNADLMECQVACWKIRRDYAENNQEVVVEIQGNYLNFGQNLAEKNGHHKSQQNSTAVWQKPSWSSKFA